MVTSCGTDDTGVAVGFLMASWDLFRDVFDERRLLVLRRCNADLFLDDGAKSRMCT